MKRLVKLIATLVLVLLTTCSVVAQTPVQVEIESVDVRSNSISVTHNGKTRKLAIAPKAEITLEGKKADLVSLLPGNTASIVFDKNLAAVTSIAAQRSAILPAETLAEGWDEIDDRLIFLMVRLASTEASLEAIDDALAASNRNQSRKGSQARQAENKNTEMDRKGGGPLHWSLFYGRTAESFFYHPTDRNSTYHTVTILSQQAPVNDNQTGPGVPSRQGLPVHQRPPQFDYIYRANESAKARAEKEIATLVGKTAELSERKHRLEAEQAGLWCEIAFRSVSHYDLDKKPLYRFEPMLRTASDTDARVQFETARSAASFMALALSIVDAAQKDQQQTFRKMKPAITKARQDMNDAWLRIGVDVTDRKSVEGRFHSLAKKLEESASNLSDSYVVAMEGDMAKDQQRKDTFRGLLQESIIRYAEIILALDEMATLMKDDWQIKPDIDKPIRFVRLEGVESIPSITLPKFESPSTGTTDKGNTDGWIDMFDGKTLDGWRIGGDPSAWRVDGGVIVCNGKPSHLFYDGNGSFKDFHFRCDVKCHKGSNSGVYFHTQFKDQGFPWAGFECQICNNTDRKKTGSLYGLVDVANPGTQDGKWFKIDIFVEGKLITIKIDGRVVVNYREPSNQKPTTDFERLIGEGTFALQSNSPGSETNFKNLQVRRLED